MKRTLLLVLVLLDICFLYAEQVMNPLAEKETLSWEYERSILCFSRNSTDGRKEVCYRTSDYGYSVTLSKSGKKAWFYTDRALYLLDGNSGELKKLDAVQLPYIVSPDETRICYQDHKVIPLWDNTRKECDFHFRIVDADTGKLQDTVTWNLFNWGDEVEFAQSEQKDSIRINYVPAGLEYAEADLNMKTLELTVIRDDSHLSYGELPKKYKVNEHP